jgi:hypothetical protein
MKKEEVKTLYRCIIGVELENFNAIVDFDEFEVIKHTKCGFWIHGYGKKRFVLNSGNRRFAFPTKEEAEVNYIYRTHKRLKYLKTEVESVDGIIKSNIFKDLMKKHELIDGIF